MVYLDFKKAFDKVTHRRLLAKVRACGVTGQVANWIANWLSDRMQRVAVSRRMSCWEDVSSEVPQGSVLGPLLIIILRYLWEKWHDKVKRWNDAFSCHIYTFSTLKTQ